ncbi:inosine/xanthosine triphosphatase [Anoxybacillus tepidamans]|uniref:Probable inosine/xanthosine triphosphatase n=1 Tax=Anoxybacteroides tepidamans TaxID=265948 RepID=A0A7W8IPY5_9BACL|nr:DUF84 family protein [Anoxybacillus tepidamans]MBB5324452.1 inosine/xanthosine triphosphatase [Anoxybacillus tepidamans]
MMIAVGTTNRAKVAAVEAVFTDECDQIVPVAVDSGVAAQPFSDEETRMGAIHRAKQACTKAQADVGIGLEGGVVEMDGALWVCNWGALVDRNGTVICAGGARFPLPCEVAEEVLSGKELGEVMDEYTGKRNIRQKEGAVGVFTNGYVNRTDMFCHIVKLLAGQYEFFVKTNDSRYD